MKKRQKKQPITTQQPKMTQQLTRLSPADEIALEELVQRLLPTLTAAIQSGSWMIPIFYLNGVNVEMRRITNDFPTIDFSRVIELLENSCIAERKKIKETEAGLAED